MKNEDRGKNNVGDSAVQSPERVESKDFQETIAPNESRAPLFHEANPDAICCLAVASFPNNAHESARSEGAVGLTGQTLDAFLFPIVKVFIGKSLLRYVSPVRSTSQKYIQQRLDAR